MTFGCKTLVNNKFLTICLYKVDMTARWKSLSAIEKATMKQISNIMGPISHPQLEPPFGFVNQRPGGFRSAQTHRGHWRMISPKENATR